MQRLSFFILLTLFFTCSPKVSRVQQEIAAEDFKNVKLDDLNDGIGPCEPSIVINPVNTKNIVAGAILNRVYISEDSGLTWKKQTLRSSSGVFGDPVLTADHKGNIYYAHLSDPSGTGWGSPQILDRIVVQKSKDGGKTWNDGTFPEIHHPKDQDKQWLCVNPANQHIYMTWTEFDEYGSRARKHKSRILFSKSVDTGENWSDPLIINQKEGDCVDDDYTVEGAVPASGPNNEIYVAWAFNDSIYFDMSHDGGETWLEEDIIVADQPGGWNYDVPGIFRTNGLPVTICDLSSGPFRGTIYVNWTDQRNGETDTDVWLAKSTDGGLNWSAPIRVNDDPPGKHQFFTWMAMDQKTGQLFFVFYDRRNHDGEKTDVYLAISKDGGETFQNLKISESAFLPNRSVFFGDYNHISVYDGIVRPIWTRLDGAKLSVWTAIIDMPRKL